MVIAMPSKVTEQTKSNTGNQYSASLVNYKTINEDPKQSSLEPISPKPATDQQQSPALTRSDSYKSRSIFAFLVMKL